MGTSKPTQYDFRTNRTAKPVKFGSRFALLVGFGGLLFLMVFAEIDSIRMLHRIEADNTKITKSYLVRRQALENVRSAVYQSSTLMSNYLLDPNPVAAEAHLASLKDLREKMRLALGTYSAALNPEEQVLFTDLKGHLDAYWSTLAPVFQWNAEERRAHGRSFLETEVFPRWESLLRISAQIDLANERALNAGDKRSAELFYRFRRQIGIMMASTVGLGLLLAGMSIAQILRLDKEARFRYEEILRAREELERLSASLVEAQEQERRTISRELHDEVGQLLSALLVDLGNMTAVVQPENEEARRLLGTVKKLAEESVKALRNIALLLRPSMLDDLGLIPALHWQAREVSRRTGMRVDVVAENVREELPEEHKTCVYRVVQEALHNCSRHASAQAVRVVVREKDEHLLLTIQDDGKGFDPAQTRGLGLIGMEERVKHLGGTFQLRSQSRQGTLLSIELPLSNHVVQQVAARG